MPEKTESGFVESKEKMDAKITVRRRRRPKEEKQIIINDDSKILTEEEKEARLWLDLNAAMKSRKILTGRVEGIEKTSLGIPIAIVYYKERRIVIPATEMLFDINEYRDQSKLELLSRYSQILSRMMGAEIDFIISGIDRETETVVASRKEAMLKKRQHYYLSKDDEKPRITVGKKVEARIIAVGDKVMRLEIFGAESVITTRNAGWEWIEDLREYYEIGQRIFVKIMDLEVIDVNNIKVVSSIKAVTENPAKHNIKKCAIQGKYVGTVTGIDENVIFVRLKIGVNALALGVHGKNIPSKRDEVVFVVTRIDEENGIAVGIISKVLKQFI